MLPVAVFLLLFMVSVRVDLISMDPAWSPAIEYFASASTEQGRGKRSILTYALDGRLDGRLPVPLPIDPVRWTVWIERAFIRCVIRRTMDKGCLRSRSRTTRSSCIWQIQGNARLSSVWIAGITSEENCKTLVRANICAEGSTPLRSESNVH